MIQLINYSLIKIKMYRKPISPGEIRYLERTKKKLKIDEISKISFDQKRSTVNLVTWDKGLFSSTLIDNYLHYNEEKNWESIDKKFKNLFFINMFLQLVIIMILVLALISLAPSVSPYFLIN